MHGTPHTQEGEQEDEEEEEAAAMEEAKEAADRRKQSSTTLVVSLSMPAVGFVFSCAPVGHVGGRGGGTIIRTSDVLPSWRLLGVESRPSCDK